MLALIRAKISHDIVLPATIMLTYAGQALLRVRGRVMHLRAGLDGEDAGNTCRIIKLSLVHLSLTLMPDICL